MSQREQGENGPTQINTVVPNVEPVAEVDDDVAGDCGSNRSQGFDLDDGEAFVPGEIGDDDLD